MVVVALRGSNIPVLPVPKHNSALFSRAEVSACLCRNAEENRAEASPKRNFFPAVLRNAERRRPMQFINETE
jgi:hypothetical protein